MGDIQLNGAMAWRRKCDGTETVAAPNPVTRTSNLVDSDTFTRPSSPEKARWTNGFRPYTNHSCTGRKATMVPGTTQLIDFSACHVDPWTDNTQEDISQNTVYLTGVGFGPMTTLRPFSENDERGLLTQAYAEATEPIFDVSTNVGELPEVAMMMLEVYRRVRTAVAGTIPAYLKRLASDPSKRPADLRDYLRLTKDFSDFWLEYRYGWRPLMGSIEDLQSAIKEVKIGPQTDRMYVGKAVYQRQFPSRTVSVTQSIATGSTNAFKQGVDIKAEFSHTLRASVAAQIRPLDCVYSADPLVTAFELVPLSFVLGWLISIEAYLATLARNTIPVHVSLCTSETVLSKVEFFGVEDWEPNPGRLIASPLYGRLEEFEYTRKVHASFVPTVRPNFRMDELKILDLTAILRQFI